MSPTQHETANVIWSYHQDDPANSDGPTTRHTNQGSAPVNLLGGLVGAPAIPPNAKRLNVNVNNVSLARSLVANCKRIKLLCVNC